MLRAIPHERSTENFAVNGCIRIDGVEGETEREGYKGWSRIYSLDRSVFNSGQIDGPGSGAGKAQFDDIAVTKQVDSATPVISQATASGKHIPSAEIVLFKELNEGAIEYYRYGLANVFIAGQQVGGTDSDGVPRETVHLAFGKITITYTPIGEDGSSCSPVSGSWDRMAVSQ